MEFITQSPRTVAPEQSEGATKGLRVIISVDLWVLKSNCYVESWIQAILNPYIVSST